MPPPCQPNSASSCATVAPLFAARVAPTLRKPCADLPCTLRALRVADPRSRIDLDHVGPERPPEQPAHGVQKVAGLRRGRRTPVAPLGHALAADRPIRRTARLLDDALEDILALPASCHRQVAPR